MKNLTKFAGLTVGCLMLAASPASAQITSINDLLNKVRAEADATAAENRQREAEFNQRVNQQSRILEEAKTRLRSLESQASGVQRTFDANQRRIDGLTEELNEAQGEFRDVFGLARSMAGEFKATLDNSMVSVQDPDRTAVLARISESNALPSSDELNYIWTTMLSEMEAQREIATFQAEVANEGEGNTSTVVDVTRIGPFNIMNANTGAFLDYTPPTSEAPATLKALPRPVTGVAADAAGDVVRAGAGALVNAPIDPTRGDLIRSFERVPTLKERFGYGGIVAWVIAGVFFVGVALGIIKIFMLLAASAAVRSQKRKSQGSSKNPLGRIMLAADGARDGDEETLELKLDEAILKETPKLEFGLTILKLLAGIAPLLGLLGTVTGMIKTFQAMMIFGTGDPQLMAGGISEALVTTALGLIAAIPLLILHSFCASMARGVQATLEEQSAGIVARHIENRRG